MTPTRRVLFLCTGNSARSQMAEALLRADAESRGTRIEVASAGVEPHGVNPLTLEVLAELSIDHSGAESKHLERFLDQPWDDVVTVCDSARESCPLFPGAASRLHWSFPDPAAAHGTREERLAVFREVRDAIHDAIRDYLAELSAQSPADSIAIERTEA